ncbi:hypothetical protein VTK73DRAFT_8807 [Phialemonium thermophilum]|uniref:Uncharacterized protein n=1 Tax=Phialemonium thermophilum TaxID=223376 RepID=A0ABR3W677_9PEZI
MTSFLQTRYDAGSAALLGFLLHLHHPHPKVDRFTLLDDDAKSLGRILLISPWGPVCTASMVVDGAAYEGRLGVEALKGLWQLFASTHPETEIVNPWTTPQFVMYEDWYAQLPAGEITTLIGGKELARHEMIRIANVIKVYHKAPSHLVIDEASDHGAFVGEHLFHLPPSDMTKSVYRWAKGGD